MSPREYNQQERAAVQLRAAAAYVPPTLDLTQGDIALLLEALNSHAYWQIAPDYARNDGFVIQDVLRSDEDAEAIEALAEVEALEAKLNKLLGGAL